MFSTDKFYLIALAIACISREENEFQCLTGVCIPKNAICNGTEHCPDGSDVSPTFCANKNCPVGTFKCSSNNICISEYRVCDGSNDCEDKSDEEQSMCLKRPCLFKSLFKCHDTGACIHKGYLCDSVNDCND
ncbi:hypothetical protein PV328_010434 [Microctonus aethiopoides]|uniref:Uncharacterized protein n=1 Tax=Microctonus aethiopoides TaxID=144406 RepID=A0AA39KQ53_9HYME|nr:hypothetical protein PV328_010434 [Microctonus aethiopoides]